MKFTIKLYRDKKDQIKSMFSRTIILQKSKVQTNGKKYKRQKFNLRQNLVD